MMAWVAKIDEIKPIPEADKIAAYRVGGWWVVDKKDAYNIGDPCVYVSIDSWVPHDLAPFLSKNEEPKEYNGVKGERLRTVRLKKQISQGLLLPVNVCWTKVDLFKYNKFDWQSDWSIDQVMGMDYTEALGIQKWEAPIPASLSGQVRGAFPSCVPKTDQERVANLTSEWDEYRTYVYEISEKCEGTSCTMVLIDGDFHVCSRNLSLYKDENTIYWKVALKNDIENKLRNFGYDNIAIQAEVLGPGIQNNIYGMSDHDIYVFDVYDIKSGTYYASENRIEFCKQLKINHVPILSIEGITNKTIEDIILMADGVSQLNKNVRREGIVFKSISSPHHFKSVSAQYLLKSDL